MTVESSKIAKKERKVVLVVLVIIPCFFCVSSFLAFFAIFLSSAEGSFFFQWNAQVSTERRDDDKETMTVMTVPILDLAKRSSNQSGMKPLLSIKDLP